MIYFAVAPIVAVLLIVGDLDVTTGTVSKGWGA